MIHRDERGVRVLSGARLRVKNTNGLRSRRRGLRLILIGIVGMACGEVSAAEPARGGRVAVIDVTDLYHPPQDPGDNFDLIAAYALPEIDLKAVVLDVTQRFREPVAEIPELNSRDPGGPRAAGIVPVTQLNYIFGRDVPVGVGPFTRMRSPDDQQLDVPAFQQFGIDLLLETLSKSSEKVDIVCFGSARPVAVAYNRRPELLRAKVRRIHLCAGASSREFLEWNVMLDSQAMVRLLRSDLPIAIYPCATEAGPFAYGRHNCFWLLPDLKFIAKMRAPLRRYLAFAFARSERVDFLRAMDEDPPVQMMNKIYQRQHKVWETSVWIQVANRRLVRRAGGAHRLVPADQVRDDDTVLPNELRPCRIDVGNDGRFAFTLTDERTNFLIYDRGDPHANEIALREALPALYESFRVK